MNSRKQYVTVVLFAIVINLQACNYNVDKYSANQGQTIDIANATLDSHLQNQTTYLDLTTASTADVGCTKTGAVTDGTVQGTSVNYNSLTTSAGVHANLFTPATYMKVSGLKLRLKRNSSPAGNLFASVNSAGATDPLATSLGTSAAVSVSTISAAPGGALASFALSSPVEIVSTSTYAVLLGISAAVMDNSNFYSVVTSGAGECSSLVAFRTSADSGSTWGAGQAPAGQRTYFSMTTDVHASSGQATWIIKNTKATWLFSTFTMAENTRIGTSGTITYDVGTGESDTTATYDHTGLTLTQVQALSNATSTYLYLRASLSVASPYYDQAELGNGSITVE